MLSLDAWLDALQPGVDTLRVVPKGARWRVVSVSRDPDSILLQQNHPRNLGHTYELTNRAMIQHSREMSETDPPPRVRESYRKPERPTLPPGYTETPRLRLRPALTTPRRPRRALCYRLYDRHSVLLYVGYTTNPAARMTMHRATQSWWHEVSYTVPTWYDTEQEAADAERNAILCEFPVYNVCGVLRPYISPV